MCAFLLALAPAALASPATTAYGGPCSTPSLCNTSSITSKAASGASLPFTGINVLEVAAMGLVLVGAGFVVRHSRRPSND
ncbi:MAG: hypothetical protein M3071_10320 [Actinomycetota bacterium]|nr:hypothetical protein [Actinomycetota bacterium]